MVGLLYRRHLRAGVPGDGRGRGPTLDPCVLIVEFRLRAVRGRGHAAFRVESMLNTPLFAGFPPASFEAVAGPRQARGRYRGVYEWDGPRRAENYARACGGYSRWCRCEDRSATTLSAQGLTATCCLSGRARWQATPRMRQPGGALPKPRDRAGGRPGSPGAGPAGLALACRPIDHGAAVRVIDRRPEAVRPSRALILHPRTLEVLRPLGVTQALLPGRTSRPADLQLGWRASGSRSLALRHHIPHLSLIRQIDVEQVLPQRPWPAAGSR